MEAIKEHFEEEAKGFDKIIQKLIPYYVEMIDGMVEAIPYQKTDSINIIDLGCGTGTIAYRIKQKFPKSNMTCLDIAKNMLEMSKIKLNDYSNVQYQLGDFQDYQFTDTYHVIVSSLALHHLVTDEDKIRFYRKIHEALNTGGIFLNADVVLGSNKHYQRVFMDKWRAFMKRQVCEEDIENIWIPKYLAEDRPARLTDHLNWLKKLGFDEIDVIWKYYNFAVYCGRKQ